uniref:Uncharacterized protein n=1 Tax=Cucumis melo TaxID=3656 RepID=A0A9I9DJM3_CUCME
MTMMSALGPGDYGLGVSTIYYDSRIGPSSSYMDVGLSTSYMYGHERDHGEHTNICNMKH